MLDGQKLRDQVMSAIEQSKTEGGLGQGYLLSSVASEPTVMSLCFAVLTCELYNNIPDEEVENWIQMLLEVQDLQTGLFIDPLLSLRNIDLLEPGVDYTIYQTTYFALNALDALGVNPRYPLTFVEPYLDHDYLSKWLKELDWSDPWKESNWVMFIGGALYHRWHWDGDRSALRALHCMLDWLDAHQDPETGFWGIQDGASLLHAMAAAYHFLPFYFSVGCSIQYPERMIESTLTLQQPDGLFHPDGGGDTCLDVDAIDILVKCSLITNHLSVNVDIALERTFHGVLNSQGADGGFCRALRKPFPPKSQKRRIAEAIGLDLLLRKPYSPPRDVRYYDGWTKMPYDVRQSDLFSTWFRSLGLALISTRYPDKFPLEVKWRFRKIPALGWHDPEKIVGSVDTVPNTQKRNQHDLKCFLLS